MKQMMLLLAALLVAAQAPAAVEGSVFQPTGENLLIQPPPDWRLAYMDGDPDGNYVVEFLPRNESHDAWREGYMSVQRRHYASPELRDSARAGEQHPATMAVQQVLQGAQRQCAGRFTRMSQKEALTHNAYTSVGGGFCDRYGAVAPYGEGNMVAVVEGTQYLFLVQFGWRPATEGELKEYGWRITPQRLQQYLDLLNRAALCGGQNQNPCPL